MLPAHGPVDRDVAAAARGGRTRELHRGGCRLRLQQVSGVAAGGRGRTGGRRRPVRTARRRCPADRRGPGLPARRRPRDRFPRRRAPAAPGRPEARRARTARVTYPPRGLRWYLGPWRGYATASPAWKSPPARAAPPVWSAPCAPAVWTWRYHLPTSVPGAGPGTPAAGAVPAAGAGAGGRGRRARPLRPQRRAPAREVAAELWIVRPAPMASPRWAPGPGYPAKPDPGTPQRTGRRNSRWSPTAPA